MLCVCVLQGRVVGGGNRSLHGLGGAPDDGGDAHLQRRQKHNTENGAGHHGAIRRGECVSAFDNSAALGKYVLVYDVGQSRCNSNALV